MSRKYIIVASFEERKEYQQKTYKAKKYLFTDKSTIKHPIYYTIR